VLADMQNSQKYYQKFGCIASTNMQ